MVKLFIKEPKDLFFSPFGYTLDKDEETKGSDIEKFRTSSKVLIIKKSEEEISRLTLPENQTLQQKAFQILTIGQPQQRISVKFY